MQKHRVTLSNGRVLLIEEQEGSLHFASEQERFPLEADYYIAEFNASGVLVMPNSGDALVWLTENLGQDKADTA